MCGEGRNARHANIWRSVCYLPLWLVISPEFPFLPPVPGRDEVLCWRLGLSLIPSSILPADEFFFVLLYFGGNWGACVYCLGGDRDGVEMVSIYNSARSRKNAFTQLQHCCWGVCDIKKQRPRVSLFST